jgi:segregation and condensation protein A
MTETTGKYHIRISQFEGPFDLLLYLVRNAKINLHDLSISEITGQFVVSLQNAELDLESVSEFIFTAAQLLYLKSRLLLPQSSCTDLDAGEEPEDDRREFVHNLIEYQKYRKVSGELRERLECAPVLLRRDTQLVMDFQDGENWEEISILDLIMAFSRVARELDTSVFRSVEMERISIEDKIDEIVNLLIEKESILFASLFPRSFSKYELIITFLALLELVKMRKLYILQHRMFGSIKLVRREIG